MQLGQDASGRPLTGYQRRSLGIDPALNPLLVRALVAQGLHVSGVNDRPRGGMVPHQRTAQPAPGVDLSAMGGGLNAIPGPALEGGPTFNQGMDELHAAGPVGRPAQPVASAQQAALMAKLQQLQAMQGGGAGAQPVMHPQDEARVQNVAQGLMRRLAMHRQLQGLISQRRAMPGQGAVRPMAPAGPVGVGGHVAM